MPSFVHDCKGSMADQVRSVLIVAPNGLHDQRGRRSDKREVEIERELCRNGTKTDRLTVLNVYTCSFEVP